MRKQRKSKSKYSQVQEQIKKLLNSPLGDLAMQLKSLIDAEDRQNIEYVSKVLERLPKELNRSFYFDTWMIQSIVQSWGDSLGLRSRMIIPTHYHEWGYERIPIPTNSTVNPSFAVSFIHIPSAVTEIPSLLDYPWLCHELGHHLLSMPKHKQMLFDKFHPYPEELISKLRIMSISDRGLAKIRSQATIDEINTKWRDSKWVEELAIDVIALWACGPAYLAAFQDEHEQVENPFIIELTHPPVELRTYALLHAARKLGWDKYLVGLKQMQDGWYRKIPSSIGNLYRSLRNSELVTQCVAAALNYCKSSRIPRLKLEDLNKMCANMELQNDFSNGIELIVAAWLVYYENEEYYDDWEKQTFNKLTDEIRQDSVK